MGGGIVLSTDLKKPEQRQTTRTEDEILIEFARAGDNQALERLIEKYRHLVRAKSRSYFLIGGDYEDIIQEGMIGLYKAVRDFRGDKLSSFRAFAELCITRQIITAIKTATRQKHSPLNSYISLDKPVYEEDSERPLLDILVETHAKSPEDLLIIREKQEDMETKIGSVLSELEQQVLQLYIDGRSYQEMSGLLGRRNKSIDNALQRIKRKLENCEEWNALIS
ncbi:MULTISPECIES: RNA polymerase sporulation sigma factor SigH [Marinococcus]|jgi:RNA polymerase sporulation-specific sigma factor|uniref:RNA polymerase sporulation sigma factor SigH n=1 Tax=Marinococcus TaxID=1370 RepID=UPI0029C22188|nr:MULTISPECIES: RNA polymerase sporulation sigma factor SigH [Marinococcus]MDX6151364.1 RNA polymerase sporulation sigma factor SigH [Marinococcus sp. PL1-022]MDZ5784538.1 RNA polymerase sporulation sigma factor SigH [Marinococcus luteus]